jgi:hypothetical protein
MPPGFLPAFAVIIHSSVISRLEYRCDENAFDRRA